MKIVEKARDFAQNESGAVTVDWVVLTAAIVGLGIAVVAAVSDGVTGLGGTIKDSLSNASITPESGTALNLGSSSTPPN